MSANNKFLEISQVGIEFPTANGPFVALKGVDFVINE